MRVKKNSLTLNLVIHANLISCLITLVATTDLSFFLRCILITGLGYFAALLVVPGFLIGLCIQSYAFWLCQQTYFVLDCQETCVIKAVIDENIEKFVMPVKVYGVKAVHQQVIAKGNLEYQPKDSFLPLRSFILTEVIIQDRKDKPSIRPWSNSSKKLQTLYDCFLLGKVDYNQAWVQGLGRLGLLHFLCFSGWHVHQLYEFLYKKYWLFVVSSFLLTLLLSFPFPWVRAIIYFMLRKNKIDKFLSWHVSVWGALLFDPFAWSTWSFWMTCYYSLWLEYKINSPWLLRLAGLAWSGLLQSSVDLVLFFLGSVLESPVALGLISFCLLSVGAACWCSYFFDLAFELLDAIFSFIVGQSFFPLALSNNFCLLILFCVFYFSPSKTKGISS